MPGLRLVPLDGRREEDELPGLLLGEEYFGLLLDELPGEEYFGLELLLLDPGRRLLLDEPGREEGEEYFGLEPLLGRLEDGGFLEGEEYFGFELDDLELELELGRRLPLLLR